MTAHDPPMVPSAPATPTLTTGSRDRIRLALSRQWRRRTARRLAVAIGAAGLRRLGVGDHCEAFRRAAFILDRAPTLSVAALDRAAAAITEADAGGSVDLMRRIVAATVRSSAGSPCPRRAAAALRMAAVWRCAVRGTAARCPCIMDSFTAVVEPHQTSTEPL